MAGVRRSGRIPKEIPIVLLGTDTSGRVFSEETRTLVLSRHGAGILSRNKFAPHGRLTPHLPGSTRATEIRLVGNLGEEPRGNVYGVAFSDPEINFWQVDFPAAPENHLLPAGAALECCFCGERSLVQQTEIEADVFLASQSVIRFCELCSQSTPWKPATGDISESPRKIVPAPAPAREPAPSPFVPPPATPPSCPASAPPRQSAYAATALLDDIVHASFAPLQPAASAATAAVQTPPPQPTFSSSGKPNRRRHVRT